MTRAPAGRASTYRPRLRRHPEPASRSRRPWRWASRRCACCRGTACPSFRVEDERLAVTLGGVRLPNSADPSPRCTTTRESSRGRWASASAPSTAKSITTGPTAGTTPQPNLVRPRERPRGPGPRELQTGFANPGLVRFPRGAVRDLPHRVPLIVSVGRRVDGRLRDDGAGVSPPTATLVEFKRPPRPNNQARLRAGQSAPRELARHAGRRCARPTDKTADSSSSRPIFFAETNERDIISGRAGGPASAS